MKTSNNIQQDKQLNYILDLTLKTPYELFIDDIKIASNYSRGSNAAVELNPYVLKNGKYKIRLKLFPVILAVDSLVEPNDIKNSSVGFGNYVKNKETGEVISYDIEKYFTLNVPSQSIPSFEQEWEIDVKNLPYDLEGWSKGQDLSKMNQNELEKKVVSYYQTLWEILNNGEGEKFVNLWKVSDNEAVVFDCITSFALENINNKLTNEVSTRAKNTMIPLEDYEMKLYGDGKLVTLERKSHTREFNEKSPLDLKGWSPLIREHDISGGTQYPVLLYLPQNSNKFIIIRK